MFAEKAAEAVASVVTLVVGRCTGNDAGKKGRTVGGGGGEG